MHKQPFVLNGPPDDVSAEYEYNFTHKDNNEIKKEISLSRSMRDISRKLDVIIGILNEKGGKV